MKISFFTGISFGEGNNARRDVRDDGSSDGRLIHYIQQFLHLRRKVNLTLV